MHYLSKMTAKTFLEKKCHIFQKILSCKTAFNIDDKMFLKQKISKLE